MSSNPGLIQQVPLPEGVLALANLWAGTSLDDEQLRALAVGAWEANSNHLFHDTLEAAPGRGGPDPATLRAETIDDLIEAWSVAGRDDAMRIVVRLHSGLHAPLYGAVHPLVMEAMAAEPDLSMGERDAIRTRHLSFLENLAGINDIDPRYYTDHYRSWTQAQRMGVCSDFPHAFPDDIHAWDLERAAWVIRASVTAGYLEPDEAWSLLMDGLEMARARYANWRQFGASCLAGFYFWHADEDLATTSERGAVELHRIQQLWMHPLSPWRRLELHVGYPSLTLTPAHDLVGWTV